MRGTVAKRLRRQGIDKRKLKKESRVRPPSRRRGTRCFAERNGGVVNNNDGRRWWDARPGSRKERLRLEAEQEAA